MADSLVAALVQASKKFADPIAASYASGNRPYIVELRRPAGGMPSFNRATGVFLNPDDPLLYSGPARIYTASGGVEMEIGDETTPFTSATVTIDLYDGPAPETDDTITVLDTAQSQATHIADRVFEVNSVTLGGHFGIGWQLQVMGAAPSRHG